jgi:hypothetical protein
MRGAVLKIVEDTASTEQALATAFDTCRTEVYQLMKKDLFARFIKTSRFRGGKQRI